MLVNQDLSSSTTQAMVSQSGLCLSSSCEARCFTWASFLKGLKLDGKDEDFFLFEHGIDIYWLLASTRVDHCECSWYLGLVWSALKNFWWFALCHPAFSCFISHASLPGEVIKTMVNGKEETRNTAQENDFVVQLGFWKRRLATSMTFQYQIQLPRSKKNIAT